MIQRGVTPETALSVVPLPPRPGLYLILGPRDLVPWALQTITLAFPAKPVFWIDAANQCDAHLVSIAARCAYQDPVAALKAFRPARPFTAYQLEAMVTQKLQPTVQRIQAFFSVIADPLSLYEGAEGRDTQVRQSFRRFMQGVREASVKTPVVVLIPEPGPQRYLPELLHAATWRRRLEDVGQRRRLVEA